MFQGVCNWQWPCLTCQSYLVHNYLPCSHLTQCYWYRKRSGWPAMPRWLVVSCNLARCDATLLWCALLMLPWRLWWEWTVAWHCGRCPQCYGLGLGLGRLWYLVESGLLWQVSTVLWFRVRVMEIVIFGWEWTVVAGVRSTMSWSGNLSTLWQSSGTLTVDVTAVQLVLTRTVSAASPTSRLVTTDRLCWLAGCWLAGWRGAEAETYSLTW